MHNPFSSNVSPSKLGLTYETKSAVMPEITTCLPARIAQMRKQADALEQKLESELAQIWVFYGGLDNFLAKPKNLSKSFLGHLKSIRYPENNRFFGGDGAKQKRWDFGNYFEDLLDGKDTINKYTTLGETEVQNAQRMCNVAKSDANFSEWLNSHFVEKQKKVHFDLFGYRFTVVLDFYAEAGSEAEKKCYSAELKTTTQVTEYGFEKACTNFGYWLQYRLYSEVAPDGYEIYGISKKKDRVLRIVPTKEHYEAGEKDLLESLALLDYYGISHYFKAL